MQGFTHKDAVADTTQRKVSVSWQGSAQMAVLETSVVPDEKMPLEAENEQLKGNIDPQRERLQSMNYKLLVKEK